MPPVRPSSCCVFMLQLGWTRSLFSLLCSSVFRVLTYLSRCFLQTWTSTALAVTASFWSTSSRRTWRRRWSCRGNFTWSTWQAARRSHCCTAHHASHQHGSLLKCSGDFNILMMTSLFRWVKQEQKAPCWTKPRTSTSLCLLSATSSLLWVKELWVLTSCLHANNVS